MPMRVAVALAVLLASTPAIAAPAISSASRASTTGVRILRSDIPRGVAGAFDRLARDGWRASWDADTGVAAWLWGGRVDAPGATTDAARAERAARAFVIAHLDVLAPGLSPGDLELVANQLDGDLRTIGFRQTWRGLRVVGGQVGVVIGRDRIIAATSAAWPAVTVSIPARTDRAAQRSRAEQWISTTTGVRAHARATGERVVVPEVRSGGVTYAIADVVDVTASSGPERWDVYAAPDGTPLRRTSRVMSASAKLLYNAGIRHGGGTRADYPAPAATITVNGTATTTAADGGFSWSGTAPSNVVTSTTGTYVRIINQAGTAASDTLTAAPSATAVWNRALEELDDAQVSTYVYANIAKARARIVNPGASAWLDTQLDFFVNENGACNAYSTGNDVHLVRSSATCANTGLVGDVVLHEFGHSLHNHSFISGVGAFEGNLSEGLADFFAANITNDPAVGRGFFKSDEPLRQIDPPGIERVYPIDFDFDEHVSGLIIGGALWDLRKDLIAELGVTAGVSRAEKIFLGVMQRANDISTTYMAALLADDDDADLGNGTPNFCALERAFGRHGLVPGYVTTSVTPPSVDHLAITVAVSTPTGTTCTPPAISTITVTWRANDGVPSELQLAQQDTATWTGAFPEQEEGTVIAYSVDVLFDDGALQSFPNNPADPRYQLFTGGATPLWCENMDADPGWEQSSNGGFQWQWAAAIADTGTVDPDTAFTNDHVLGTILEGDGSYRPSLISSIETPPLDVSAFETVRLQYRRGLTVEDSLFDKATIEVNGMEAWRNASAQNGTLDHVDREWRFHDVDLTPYIVDGNVSVRWSLSSDFGKELGGWTLDDVCIVGLVKVARCGDGEVDYNEQCDDGNHDSDDGCASDCIDEVTAGGGGCCSAGRDARGTWLLAMLVAIGLGRTRRRDQWRRRASSLVPSRSVSLRMP
jgi:cysteine-rich repeat protein